MTSTNPYLHFMGNTEVAMNFYKTVFTGQFTNFQRFRDMPGSERMPTAEQEKILHITLDIGNGILIMATDALESMGQHVDFGNNFHICIHAESTSEVDRVFGQLSAGGQVEMPLNETMWGAYFGMVTDKFGVHWMVSFTRTNTK